MPSLEHLEPRYVAELFAPLHRELIALLRTLTASDWDRPTVAGNWRVRDVTAHLLDGDLRKLAGHRDGHRFGPDRPFRGYGDIVDFINEINASGVAFARRLSPRLLTDLLDVTGRWVAEFVESLEPHAPAAIPVAWAGESQSENWMDTGREYTERWHHQMQIRDAVNAPGLLDGRWLDPLLDLSVRALPPAYASTDAPEGTAITLAVPGDARWTWTLVREGGRWELYRGESGHPATRVVVEPAVAWRLFYNALPPLRAREELTVQGDESLVEPLLRTRSVMV
ncbi:MAG TPA: maleylpyruvate isomerase N-terminal domain-containing protein [Thermoanaerobaculia bacterium]|nr:maleylpyruvate isomerase N-terminal domain-containing protein [Thermoanaerobaculia bacterium]